MAEGLERIRFAVVHGRFQPFHLEHLAYCRLALEHGEALVVGVTNFDPTLTAVEPTNLGRHEAAANPFCYWERSLMIRDALLEAGVPASRFAIVAMPVGHPERLHHYVPCNPKHAVHVLRIYSAWEEEKARRFASVGIRVAAIRGQPKRLNASEVRRRMAANEDWESCVPPAAHQWLVRLDGVERVRALLAARAAS